MTIATIADIAEIETIPLDRRGWARNTYDLLTRAAESFGDAPALTWLPDAADLATTSQWSFRELLVEVTAAANLFVDLGCGATDVVAYMLPNLPQAHFVLWGAEAAGIAFPVNPALSADMALALLGSMRVKVLVTAPAYLTPEMRHSLETRLRDLPDLSSVLVIGDDAFAPRDVATFDFDRRIAEQPRNRVLADRTIEPGDASSAFCTGGTTGAPKVALRTHGAEAADAHMLGLALDGFVGPDTRAFCGLPLFHVNANLVTGLAPWVNGAHVVLGPPLGYRDRALVDNFWRIVEHFKLTYFSGVPTIYSTLMEIPIADADVSSLRLGICGAAPMPKELLTRFEKTTGIRILEGYGLTETVCTATMNPVDGERPIGSIGLRLPYQKIRIVEIDTGGALVRECLAGEVGTIALAGPNIFSGYADPSHDEEVWIEFGDGQRWLNSGDLGHIDERGHIWLTGRRKELIIRGGHNIDPKMIEEAMHRHPDVALAAAVGRPDAHAGEVPVVYIELRPEAHVERDALMAFASREVAERAAIPKDVIILEKLPTTVVGKLFKPALVQLEIERTVRLEAEATGVVLIAFATRQDAKRGPVAEIAVRTTTDAFTSALDRYAFGYDMNARPAPEFERNMV